MTTKQIWLIAGILVVIAASISMFLLITFLTPKQVTISYNPLRGATIKLFRVASAEELHDLTDEKQVGEAVNAGVRSGEAVSLQRGAYVVSVNGQGIEKRQYPLEVIGDTQKTITITYSRSYLNTLLKEVEPSVLAALKSSLPGLASQYEVRPGKLYQNGDWYATRLRYIGPDTENRDTLRVVVKKNGDKWELVTKTPEIIVTYPEYPTIPREIVKDVNSDEPIKITPIGQ